MIKVEETDPIGEVDPSFPFREVMICRETDMKQYYDIQNEIGRGKFGTVYRCQEKSTGLKLAAKFVSIAKSQDRRNAEREVEIMRELQHPRLIQIYDAYEISKVLCVVLELVEGGELFERVIDDDFVLTEKSVTVFMRQICEGVAFMHSKNILHLDMKPENILCLTRTGNRIKIIDFGLARKYDPGKEMQVLFGTPEFVAPEVVNFDNIGFGTDMWSVGVICYVLLSGLSPFMGETDVQTMANVTIAQYDFDDEAFNDISDDAKDFISKLLVKNIEDRMSATECLSHRWLKRRSPPVPNPSDALDYSKDNLRQLVDKWSSEDNDTVPLARRKSSLSKKKKMKKSLKANSPTSEGDSNSKGKTKIKKSKSKAKMTINNDLNESTKDQKKSEIVKKNNSMNEKIHKFDSGVVKSENKVSKITDNEMIKIKKEGGVNQKEIEQKEKVNRETKQEREKINRELGEEKRKLNEELRIEKEKENQELRREKENQRKIEEKEKSNQENRREEEKSNQEKRREEEKSNREKRKEKEKINGELRERENKLKEEKDDNNLESFRSDVVSKKSLFIKKITENNITVNRQEISMSKIVKGNSVNNMSKNYEQNINTSQNFDKNNHKEKSVFSKRMDEEGDMLLSRRISNLLDENSWYSDQVIRLSERIKNPPKRNSLNDDQLSRGKFANFRRPKFRVTSLSRDVPFGITLSSNSQFIDCGSNQNDNISSSFWPIHRQTAFHSDPGSPRVSPDRPTGPFTKDVLMRFFDRPFDKKLLSVYSSSSTSLRKSNSSEISS